MNEKLYIITPVGRIVQGHPMEPNTKGYNGNVAVNKNGEPKTSYFFSLAIEKNNPDWVAFWQQITDYAAKVYPGNESTFSGFKWKYLDGDAPEHLGKDGFATCHVLKLSQGFVPSLVDSAGNGMNGDQLKRGDFVRAQLSVGPNREASPNTGLFLNPSMIQHVAFGAAISAGPDAAEVFGASKIGYVPPGASQTPAAPAQGLPGTPAPAQQYAPAAPAQGLPGTPAPAPAQQYAPAAPTQGLPGTPAPAYDYLNPPAQHIDADVPQ